MIIHVLAIVCGLLALLAVVTKLPKVQLLFFILSQYMIAMIMFINGFQFLSVAHTFLMTGALLVMLLVTMLDNKEYLRFTLKWKRYLYGGMGFFVVLIQTLLFGSVFWRDGILQTNPVARSGFGVEVYKSLFNDYYFAMGGVALLFVSIIYTLIVVKGENE